MGQAQSILKYMQKHPKGINPMVALKEFSCFRLGARIYDLKLLGHKIESTLVFKNKKRFSQYVLKAIALLLCPMVIGCATIVSGRTQKITVNTVPSEALITINNQVQKSPAVFTLDRTVPSYQIKIEKAGYKTVEITIKRSVNGWILGNILFGGIIGLVIDASTGSMYSFTPSEIEQNLIPEGQDGLVLKVK